MPSGSSKIIIAILPPNPHLIHSPNLGDKMMNKTEKFAVYL